MGNPKSLIRSYVSASCNRYPNVLDWGDKFIAFGSCHSIALFNVETKNIEHLLNKHNAHLRSVRWILPDEVLISSCASSDTIIWKLNPSLSQFEPIHILDDGAKTNLIVSDAIIDRSSSIHTVTSANDFFLRFWTNVTLRCKVQLKNYAFDVKIINNDREFWSENTLTFLYASGECKVSLSQITSDNTFTELFNFTGHSDWIRSVDYRYTREDTLFIASAGQDNFIRIWKVSKNDADQKSTILEETFSESSGEGRFVVNLETVLAGHEAPVYCVKFIQTELSNLSVISSSLDKSVVVWEEPGNGSREEIWNERFRVGEIGGNNLGFLGISFPSNAELFSHFCAYSYNGSVHVWKLDTESGSWISDIGFSAHFDVVTDIAWAVDGKYLLSVSNDETTRLHAPWKRSGSGGDSWHEIARPQIHGYPINCLAIVNELTFVSGADEKVLRVFRGTKSFVNSIRDISGIEVMKGQLHLPETATTPALGLSNKAIYSEAQINQEGDAMIRLEDADGEMPSTCPPTEELLMQSTLWPELHKLYGHGNEVFAVASSHDGKLLASSCKATKADQASIILWNAEENFRKSRTLSGHSLTVTSIKFSPDDQMIVTVSRDRTCFLYRRKDGADFEEVAHSDKKTGIHSRIIWDVSWTPDSEFFVTVSRDKKAVCWNVVYQESGVTMVPSTESVLTLDEAIMTVDVYGQCIDSKYLVAFGLENGHVLLYTWDRERWEKVTFNHDSILRHHLSLRKVRFAPPSQESPPSRILLATCGEDFMVQIFTIIF